MKKVLALILVVAVIASMIVVPVNAASSTIKIAPAKEISDKISNGELTIEYGNPLVLKFTITSDFNLTTISGAIYRFGEVDTGEALQKKTVKNVNAKRYSLEKSPIDNALQFGSLNPGKYTLRLAAKDTSGSPSKHYLLNINVAVNVSVDAIGTIQHGKPHNITGQISSKYKLTRVAGKIVNSKNEPVTDTYYDYPNKTTFDLKSSNINNKLSFGRLNPGKYKLVIAARDEKNNTGKKTISFTVVDSLERYVFNYLTNHNLNKAAACGILANIFYECNEEVNPNAYGDYVNGTPTSYGICQWHNERWAALKSYSPENWMTLEGQLEYLMFELNSSFSNVGNYLRGVPYSKAGAKDAAEYFCRNFEKPSDPNGESTKRRTKAGYYFDNF